MKLTNGQVRATPGNGGRNGLPENYAYVFRPYVYRGKGYDIMPEAVSGDESTAYETGPQLKRGRKPGPASRHQNRCARCQRDYRSRGHLTECR